MADKSISVDLIINKAEAAKSMGDVKAALKEIKSAMLELGEEGGKDFNKLAAAASDLKEKVKDTDEQIANMKNGGLGNINTIAQGAGVAIQGMTSAMALFGAESEDVQATMMKVQAAMAFGQAIAGIEEMGKAVTALFTLIEANPIGALVTAVAALTVGIYELNKGQTEAEKAVEAANLAYEKQKEITAELSSEYDRQVKLLQAQGASEKDIVDIKKKKIDAEIAEQESAIALHKAKVQEVKDNNDIIESTLEVMEASYRKLGLDKEADAAANAIQAHKYQRAKDDLDAIKEANTEIANLKNDRAILDVELKNHEITAWKDANAEQLKDQKAFNDEMLKLNADLQAALDEQKQAAIDAAALQEQANLEFFDGFNADLAAADAAADAAMRKRIEDGLTFQQKLDRGAVTAYAGTTKFATDQMANLFGSFAEISGKHVKAQKAFNIAQAIMNTYTAVTKALATLPPPASFITAGATLAAGLANVLKIKNTDTSGTSTSIASGGDSFTMPSLSQGGNALGQPETLLNPNGTPQNQMQPQRVYVVESDITRSQHRVSVIEAQNQFH